MIFSPIDIKKELTKVREENRLINEAKAILEHSFRKEVEISSRLRNSDSSGIINSPELINSDNIFSLEEIKNICIRYRLRFLDTAHFKSQFPYEAIAEIKSVEKKYNIALNSFRIIAPADAFNLENINKDPLLFAQLGNNSFYLIHQWGKELNWFRKILVWPLQNLKSLLISLFILSALISFSISSSFMHIFNLQSEIYLRIWLTIHIFIGFFGITVWLGVSFSKTVSSVNWDSKFYNV